VMLPSRYIEGQVKAKKILIAYRRFKLHQDVFSAKFQ